MAMCKSRRGHQIIEKNSVGDGIKEDIKVGAVFIWYTEEEFELEDLLPRLIVQLTGLE